MSILHLVVAPNPILQEKSLPVSEITEEIQKLCNDMLETMYHFHGIGLSAVQVGILKRIIVVDINWTENKKTEINQKFQDPFIMINPKIIENSQKDNTYNEGCLSFPDQFVKITRPKSITIEYLDINGLQHEIKADGLFATCIQHELDHLDGITISSYISPLKRTMMINKTKKIKKNMQNVI